MIEFLLVLGFAGITAVVTFLGGQVAERRDVAPRVVSAALQFAAGIMTAIVAFDLMPSALHFAPPLLIVLAFFAGGAFFVSLEYLTEQRLQSKSAAATKTISLGLYLGILLDMVIDGVAIGVGSTLTLGTGLILTLGLAISGAPTAFVIIATAKRQGVSLEQRRVLSMLFFVAILGGATLGYLILRNQSELNKLVLIALVSGILLTVVTQSMIPEANREQDVRYSGIFFIGGLSLFALVSLYL